MKNKSIDDLREELRALMSESERIKELELQVWALKDIVRALEHRIMRVETPRYVPPPLYGTPWNPLPPCYITKITC